MRKNGKPKDRNWLLEHLLGKMPLFLFAIVRRADLNHLAVSSGAFYPSWLFQEMKFLPESLLITEIKKL